MLKRIIKIAGLSVAMLASTSCIMNFDGSNGSGTTSSNGIDYTNYTGDNMLLKVKNNSSENVVCFKGTPSDSTLLSGATAGGITGIKKTSFFTDNSCDFVLFCVTEKDYLQYKDDMEELKNKPFARLYAYYNSDAESRANLVFEISSKLGGDTYILLQNSTDYNCEIRQDGLYGTPLMFAGAQSNNTKIYANPGEYCLYPVFRVFDKKTGTIITNYPKDDNNEPMYEEFYLQKNTNAVNINVSKYFKNDIVLSPSCAYLKINNQNAVGVKLFKGANAVPSATDDGCIGINSGDVGIYTIDLDRISDDSFERYTTISSWEVGNARHSVKIPELTYEAGYRYILNVTGTSASDIHCEFAKTEAGEIDRYYINFKEIENTLAK